jgi:hypothetical protein
MAVAIFAVAGVMVLPSVSKARAKIPLSTARHWLASWTANPSDSADAASSAQGLSATGLLTDTVDPSGHPKASFGDQTVRVIITPHWGGTNVRLHLSNRFGHTPVTFDRVEIAKVHSGADAVAGSSVEATFGGSSVGNSSAGRRGYQRSCDVSVRGVPTPGREHLLGRL